MTVDTEERPLTRDELRQASLYDMNELDRIVEDINDTQGMRAIVHTLKTGSHFKALQMLVALVDAAREDQAIQNEEDYRTAEYFDYNYSDSESDKDYKSALRFFGEKHGYENL